MTLQSGSLGRFWLGPQTSKGTAATTFYGYRGSLIDVAPQQMLRAMGPLVGGGLLPSKAIKTGAWSGGACILPPACDDYLGWLLYGFTGSVTSNSLTDHYEHYFPAGADDSPVGKYLTARRKIPATTTALYEQMEDLVPTRIQLGIVPGEYTTMRYEVLGRGFSAPDGSGWGYTSKDETTVPTAVKGGVEIPDGTPNDKITGVTIDVINVVPDLRRVMTVGSYYPYDFPVMTRAITATLTCLWDEATFYKNFWYSGTAWQTELYNSSLDIYVQSMKNITGATVPYELKLWAASVDWDCPAVTPRPADLIEFQLRASLTDAASGADWYWRLRNGTASYVWPT